MTLPNPLIDRWLMISVGIYIVVVLNLFEPFGITIAGFNPIYHLLLSSYGVVSALTVAAMLHWWQPHYFARKGATAGRVLSWIALLVLAVSLSNWLYSQLLHLTISGWRNMYVPVRRFSELMPQFLAVYSLWGGICWANLWLFGRGQPDQPQSQPEEQTLTLLSDNPNDSVRLKAMQLVCMKTCDNYLELYYLDESDALKHRLIRSSMTRMAEQLDDPQFYRCHQSYLVNLAYVKGLKKVNRSHVLEMAYLEFDVAVARKHLNHMTSYLVS